MAEPTVLSAANGSDTATVPNATTPVSLRRSKRDSVAKAEPSKTTMNAQEESATSATTRRSQRSVKSTYATPTKETSVKDTTSKKSMKIVAAEATEEVTPVRRGRPPRAATVATSTELVTPISSPIRSPIRAETPSDADALMSTPTRNRRPSRRQLEVDAPMQNVHSLLEEFSANEATALCEVVWYQLRENSYKPDVLLRDRSPACIDWHRVAERLARSHDITLTPRACQRLWKFLAYAQTSDPADETDELQADSDPEDYELTADKINARTATGTAENEHAANSDSVAMETTQTEDTSVANVVKGDTSTDVSQVAASSDTSAEPVSEINDPTVSAPSTAITEPSETTATAPACGSENTTSPKTELSETEPVVRETRRTAGVQLYPEYDQPSGIPDSWLKPFDPKNSMPLVFVAEKFLKRKVVPPKDPTKNGNESNTSMEVDPSILAAAAMSVTLTGERMQPKPKKKRVSDGGDKGDKPKKPRKKKELAVPNANVKPPTATTPLTALAVAMNKSPLPLRHSYVSSLTVPPTPTPARPAVEFFGQLYKENPNIMRIGSLGVLKEAPLPAPAANMDAAQLAAIFASAPLQVRTACEQMANDDLRRFEREHLRRRLWEKTRASLQNTPVASPAGASAPPASLPTPTTLAPMPPTTATVNASAQPSSSSISTTSQISTSTPSPPVP